MLLFFLSKNESKISVQPLEKCCFALLFLFALFSTAFLCFFFLFVCFFALFFDFWFSVFPLHLFFLFYLFLHSSSLLFVCSIALVCIVLFVCIVLQFKQICHHNFGRLHCVNTM